MCEHEHHHHHNKKSPVIKIAVSAAIFAAAMIIQPAEPVRFLVFLTAYIVAGGDIVLKAIKNILKGNVFDENFLMSIATLGAFGIREYPEAVMVMILYQLGEYLQDKAVEKSRASISSLMDIRPDYANIEQNGEVIKVSPEKIKPGDVILVKTVADKILNLSDIRTVGNSLINNFGRMRLGFTCTQFLFIVKLNGLGRQQLRQDQSKNETNGKKNFWHNIKPCVKKINYICYAMPYSLTVTKGVNL